MSDRAITFTATFVVLFLSAFFYQLFNVVQFFHALYPSATPLSFLAALAFSGLFYRLQYSEFSTAFKVLLRGVAIISLAYFIGTYPAYPDVTGVFRGYAMAVTFLAWGVAIGAALLTLWRPSWAFVVGFYLWWSKDLAIHITGLNISTLTVFPLWQALMLSVIAAVMLKVLSSDGIQRFRFANEFNLKRLFESKAHIADGIVFGVMCIHLANYFYSGWRKATLSGGFTSWVGENQPGNIFVVALDNQQIGWIEWFDVAVQLLNAMNPITLLLTFVILVGQLAAIIVFRWRGTLIVFFLFADLLHLGIFMLVGANFGEWFLLNIALGVAIAFTRADIFSWRYAVLGAVIILTAPSAFTVARLGWYDSLANNKTVFLVEDAEGNRTTVPSSYFLYYSNKIGHMSFGHPPGKYFPIATNGGVYQQRGLVEKARTCSFRPGESRSPFADIWNAGAVTKFIKGYHQYALGRSEDGRSPNYHLYWHHWYPPPSVHETFRAVDLRNIVAYVLKIESVCLRIEDNKIHRDVKYVNEFRIEL
ncbi:MAG: hypothetical protein AAF493_15755 [Pseudomonadota bacterium]